MMSTTYEITRRLEGSCLVQDLHISPTSHDGLTKASSPVDAKSKSANNSVRRRRRWLVDNNLFFTLVVLLVYCIGLSTAVGTPGSIRPEVEEFDVEAYADYLLRLAEIAQFGPVLADLSTPPAPIELVIDSKPIGVERQRRAVSTTVSSVLAKTSVAAPKISVTANSTLTNSTATAGIITTSSPTVSQAASPIPSPYDNSIGTNFTVQSCPNFINSFLADSTFKSCLPISLLLQNSNGFFQASQSVVRITQTLDYTCAANLNTCTNYLSSLAANLTSSSNCLVDYNLQNPVVHSAYIGLISYKPLYQATCLKNPVTESYCFADAITNASSPEDSYIYYLPLNISLPGGATPTCSQCLQNTMAVFNANAANRTQPVSSTYVDAAKLININCGPGFVNATIPYALNNGAMMAAAPGASALFAAALVVIGMLAL